MRLCKSRLIDLEIKDFIADRNRKFYFIESERSGSISIVHEGPLSWWYYIRYATWTVKGIYLLRVVDVYYTRHILIWEDLTFPADCGLSSLWFRSEVTDSCFCVSIWLHPTQGHKYVFVLGKCEQIWPVDNFTMPTKAGSCRLH